MKDTAVILLNFDCPKRYHWPPKEGRMIRKSGKHCGIIYELALKVICQIKFWNYLTIKFFLNIIWRSSLSFIYSNIWKNTVIRYFSYNIHISCSACTKDYTWEHQQTFHRYTLEISLSCIFHHRFVTTLKIWWNLCIFLQFKHTHTHTHIYICSIWELSSSDLFFDFTV